MKHMRSEEGLMKDAKLSKFVLWSFAALIVVPTRPAAAQVTVNGRVVIPVEENTAPFGGDDAPVKGSLAHRRTHADTGSIQWQTTTKN